MEKNAERTKANILKAAIGEFAQNGFAGARVDAIAREAGCNKAMIYQYFESKEKLYEMVIASEYRSLSDVESVLIRQYSDPRDLINAVIDQYFDFLINNPEFVKILLWENLNEARCVRGNESIVRIKTPIIERVREAVRQGREQGIFREDANSKMVVFAMITGAFSFFSNRFTLPYVLNINLENGEFLNNQKNIVKAGIFRYLEKAPEETKPTQKNPKKIEKEFYNPGIL